MTIVHLKCLNRELLFVFSHRRYAGISNENVLIESGGSSIYISVGVNVNLK